ncbi:MAG: hypothetical protein A2735_03065 [Candidatus Yanofskybacteria bacterium RIFCSPHIGHO2_01_FULL_41_21]|uniref:DUF91 domain-containing protein n=1 Tax=Candidatus Yanofskybacteria bacterium RIFCSPHIGHO2_01_FULL_41_21 TaxID=1802660 RepID=A0A1F8E931_9BACT|nr:MAG: hypothetical protein A2735_03065 [Candidatus Yanofskybacteria bacterium RIFCSPHIGHO2_01_FULL_41_21]
MAIIISKNGKNAVRIDKSTFDKEDYLQKYIYDNPESIPLYDIKEDIRLLILAREFPTNSGPIDAIGIDKEGEIYIIETKLYKNPDKRTVVAQALDYGAALWKHSSNFNEFIAILNENVQKTFRVPLNQKLQEYFGLSEEELNQQLDLVKNNLSDGILHFVILMDNLDDRLKDLILYVNQNSQFDIYAVELEYYKHDTYEIIIPRIYGAEVKKDIAVSSSSSLRTSWNEEKLLNQAKELLTDEIYTNFKKIYDFSKEYADEVRLGTGQNGSFNPIWHSVRDKSLFSLYANGRMGINFHWLVNDDKSNLAIIDNFKKKLQGIGFEIPDNYTEVRPGYDPEIWSPRTDQFIQAVKDVVAK